MAGQYRPDSGPTLGPRHNDKALGHGSLILSLMLAYVLPTFLNEGFLPVRLSHRWFLGLYAMISPLS